jgi:superfamily II DNA or RNA helicase
LEETRQQVIQKLKLTYVPDDWQIHLIIRILRGFDSIFLAGTGYGKSLIFEAVAALGGKKKVTIVVCPLKALEANQVRPPTVPIFFVMILKFFGSCFAGQASDGEGD